MVDLDTITLIARETVAKARTEIQQPTYTPGTVVDVSGSQATVHIDGDPDEIKVYVECGLKLPTVGQRVQVMAVPPAALYLVGVRNGFA